MKYRTWTRNIHGVGSQLIQLLTVALVILSLGSAAYAAPREQARRIHDRLAGVPPTEAVLASMEADVDPGQNNNPIAAAFTAMDNPNFYNVTLKNFASPWTNRDRDVFVPLNDYTATVIGMIPMGTKIEIHGIELLAERKIQGSNMGSNRFRIEMPRYVDLYLNGKLNLDDLVSQRIGLDQVQEGFEALKKGEVARSVIILDS